jgi:hypothetical protein
MPDEVNGKLDRLLAETAGIRAKVDEHGERLAAIDERTKQHEGRMDRIQEAATKRGAGAGGISGAASAVAIAVLNYIFGPHAG